MPKKDAIDELVEQWERERPDLDLSPMGLFARFHRVAVVLEKGVEAELQRHDLTIPEFDVLATLRRAGAPFRLTPSALAAASMLSPGAMTNRLDRLEKRALIERVVDEEDRRSFQVSLTKKGLSTVERAVGDHVANEKKLLAPLTMAERAALDAILRKLLR